MDPEEQRSASIGFGGKPRPISWQVPFFAWSPDRIRHSQQPPGVIFGSCAYEMKPRSQLSLLFPPFYLYYCNTCRKQTKKKASWISIAAMYWSHLLPLTLITLVGTCGCHRPSSLWLYPWFFPPVGIQLAHVSSAWSSVLLATPILEVVSESQPVWFGMLIATLSLQLPLKRVIGLRGAPAISSGSMGKDSTAVIHWNPNQSGDGRQSGAWGVSFPLSEKFTLLTFGNHTLASYQGDLCISLWICKTRIFGLPWGCFTGSFCVLCKVSIGLLVIQDNASWVVSSSWGC